MAYGDETIAARIGCIQNGIDGTRRGPTPEALERTLSRGKAVEIIPSTGHCVDLASVVLEFDLAVALEVLYEGETFWLDQRRLAELFGVDVRTVNEHLGNIYDSGELSEGQLSGKSG